MEERLIIRNFGPIKDMDVVIRPCTIFIGSQGSGKSTAAKVLTICRDLSWYLSIINHDDDVLEPFKKFCIDEYFKVDTYLIIRLSLHLEWVEKIMNLLQNYPILFSIGQIL